jgi:hypothetical protein
MRTIRLPLQDMSSSFGPDALSRLRFHCLYPSLSPQLESEQPRPMMGCNGSSDVTAPCLESTYCITESTYCITESTYSITESTYCITESTYCITESTYCITESTYCITESPYCITESTYSITESTYCITESTYCITESTYCITESTYCITESTYCITESTYCITVRNKSIHGLHQTAKWCTWQPSRLPRLAAQTCLLVVYPGQCRSALPPAL